MRPSAEGSFARDALRDLIIVVGGILAALWLESWWQDQQDRAEETVLLTGLRAELVSNREQLLERIDIWQAQEEAAIGVQSFMGQPLDASRQAELREYVNGTFRFRFFDPRMGQLSSIINSGKLGLIENPELRANLADWPDLIEDLEVERTVALHTILEDYNQRARVYFAGSVAGFENRIEEFLRDREIYGGLNQMAGNNRRLVREGNVILDATNEIILMIDQQLETR